MTNKLKILLAGCSFAATLATPAKAQVAPTPPPTASRSSDDFLKGITFSLDVSEGESKAGVALSGTFAKPSLANISEPGQRTSLSWKVGIEVPVGGSDDLLDRATLGKLSNGTKISASLDFLHYTSDPRRLGEQPFMALMADAADACRKAAKTDAEKVPCAYYGPSPDFVLQYMPGARLKIHRALFAPYWKAGVKTSIAFNKIDWITPGAFTQNSSKPVGYSATVWVVQFEGNAVGAWKLEGEYSSGPKKADSQVVCRTVVVNPVNDCAFASPAAPVRKDALVARGEYRRFFPFANGKGGIGAAVTVSVDALSRDVGVEVPVFLTHPLIANIAPGLKLGYTTKEDDFTISFFIKTTFGY